VHPARAVEVDASVDSDVERDANPAGPPSALIVGGVLAVLVVPLVVALVVLHQPRWYPNLDMAETELRVRDVMSSHPPLIGLAGRIGPFGPDGGSHPGPLSFYLLWPVWALFGGSSFGLQAATVVLDIVACALALWMAFRRGGASLALGMGAILAVLMRAYGAFMLTLPWNPYLPVLWWFVFLLAAWSVLSDDLAMLPVAVFAGTLCMQTHISYLGLVGGLVAFLAGAVGYSAYRRRGDARLRRDLRRWGVIAVVIAVVLWTPPVIDQIVHTPGNLTTIREYFSHPPDAPIGLAKGIDVLLSQLNPVKLFTKTLVRDNEPFPASGARLPGALLLLVWAASVVLALRLRERILLRLDLLLGVTLALGAVSAARIFGEIFFYLLLWAWALGALFVFAIGWTIVAFIRTQTGGAVGTKLARAGTASVIAFTIAIAAIFSTSAAHVDVQSPAINRSLAVLVPPTVRALAEMKRAGQRGPYVVTWLPDPLAIGSEGYGLFNELVRAGFDARADAAFQPGATRFHIILQKEAPIEVHLATGPESIAAWRCMVVGNPPCPSSARPAGTGRSDMHFREIAFFDPRSDAQVVQYNRLHAQVVDVLRRAGMGDRVPEVDDNLFMLGLPADVPERARTLIAQMIALGMPAAVFVGPPSNGV
jgi:hypothetical protein